MSRWAETMRRDRRTLWLAAVAVALCALAAATHRLLDLPVRRFRIEASQLLRSAPVHRLGAG